MSHNTVIIISVLIGLVLICVIAMCIMISNAMDYDPAWDEQEWQKGKRWENYNDD